MQFDQHSKAIVATILAAVFWSIGGLFIKILPQDSFTILFYRSFYAAIIFVVIFRGKLFKFNKKSWITAAFYAPLLISFVVATKLTTAANAIFLQYLAPAIILILEPYILRTKLTRLNILTVVISMLGMCLFFVDQFTKPDSWLGVGLAVLSGFILAGLFISQKMNHPDYHPGAILLGNILVCIITLPWFIKNPLPTVMENNYLMILGIFQIGLGYAFIVYGQKYLTAVESSLIAMLEPILNPIWVFIGYGEKPGFFALIGGAIILGALVYRILHTRPKMQISTT
ncbi:MAG: DMT family transporter [Saprospiraceae bacterium]